MKLWSVLLILIGNVASIYILNNRLILDKSKPLSIQCFTNKSSANIEFRLELIQTCNVLSVSVVNDGRFLVFVDSLHIPNYFQLESVNTFDQSLCGTYTCIDLDTGLQDSVSVSFKDFDNDTFIIYEGDAAVYITTSCSFGATLSEMKNSWFIEDSNSPGETYVFRRNSEESLKLAVRITHAFSPVKKLRSWQFVSSTPCRRLRSLEVGCSYHPRLVDREEARKLAVRIIHALSTVKKLGSWQFVSPTPCHQL
ncbi:uncharacterized protein LOC128235724 [Mya arenaria]|uniref:uncharacterized protein LOC128235724 n=1 Tax=Mya arenaria TaxID=6604 RepID=UPI0022E8F034|nr:uncharacterized protein LOC128235724 [Mya arenaria]